MKQYEMLLAEIERRKKVLTVLGEGCIVDQRNAAEYKLLCELEEFAKGLTPEVTSEVTSEISELEKAAIEYFKEALNTGNDSKLEWFKAGANWQKQQMIKEAVEGFVEEPVMFQWRIVSNDIEGEFVVKNKLADGDKVKMIIIKEG